MNRHLKIALLMTPVLALLAYGLTGYFITNKPAKSKQSRLLLINECLPRENACLFMLGDIEIKLLSNKKQDRLQLALLSNKNLNRVSLALAEQQDFTQFPMMKTADGKYWQIKLEKDTDLLIYKNLRLAFEFEEAAFYAEAGVVF